MSANTTLTGRRIIVGVSGSIAAYKAVLLVRLLVKAGAEVQVLMTPTAAEFVSPLTFSTLSKREVLSSVTSESGWNNHVELGLWADAYVIAPATANTLAKLANGICDTVVAAVYLSARCPVFFAPAMDVDMWEHPSTKTNVQRLISYGNILIPVGEGELASGLSGAGRLAEPEDIIALLSLKLANPQPLAGKKVLVTAGPTYEPIDPVRFIGNHSSGKMGLAIASQLLNAGAEVELVLGPTALKPTQHNRLKVTNVRTAQQMHTACLNVWDQCTAGILVAAVADYRPSQVADQKIKKKDGEIELVLTKNPDIAADLGKRKGPSQKLIGFALETNDGKAHALGKLERKNLDAIVLNLHTPESSAFGGDENEVTILFSDGHEQPFGRMAKSLVAEKIVQALVSMEENG